MCKRIKKYKWQLLIISVIIVIQFAFAFQKEGYHMDELISFEMANAEYNPWIVPKQPVGRLAKFMQEEIEADSLGEKLSNISETVTDVLKNRGSSKMLSYKADVYEEPVWITREQFQNYLTTDGTDNFNYLSVYFNVKDDNHPPVHFMLLHTVSSIFKGEIHPIMGCIINILLSVGCAIVIMKCGLLLDQYHITKEGNGAKMGMMAAVFYGCSQASIATMLLIRMYGLLTFLCLLTFYIHMKKWFGNTFDRRNVGLIFVTALGFWTQYFFLFYCISLSLMICIGLLKEKRKKELFVYIRTMIIAAIIGVGCFPFAISDVFSSSRGVEALNNLRGGISAYAERLENFGGILLSRCFGDAVTGMLFLMIAIGTAVWMFIKYKEHRMILVIYYVPVIMYFLLAAKMSPMYVDRYLMASFPFVISWLIPVFFVKPVRKRAARIFIAGCMVLYWCVLVFTYDGEYLYKGYEQQVMKSEEYSDTACICLYEGYGFYDNLMEFTNYEKTLLVTPNELLERKDVDSINELQDVVLVVKSEVSQQLLDEVLEKYDLDIVEVLIEEGAHLDSVYLCN